MEVSPAAPNDPGGCGAQTFRENQFSNTALQEQNREATRCSRYGLPNQNMQQVEEYAFRQEPMELMRVLRALDGQAPLVGFYCRPCHFASTITLKE